MADDKNNRTFPWSEEARLLFTELSFNAGLETDRQLLTLSAGGLGLLLTLLTTKGADNYLTLILYGVTATLFIATIFCLLMILDKNKHHINEISKRGPHSNDLLSFLDKVAKNTFRVAAGFALVLAISIATVGIKKEEKKMADQDQKPKNTSELRYIQESVDGFSMPMTNADFIKSVNDIATPNPRTAESQNSSSTTTNDALALLAAMQNSK